MKLSPLKASLLPLVLFGFSSVYAQSNRTWVSGTGLDTNPCTRTAPCQTFAQAYTATAVGGEIDALDPGDFGPLTITASLTVDGGGNYTGVLAGGSNSITVSAGSGDIVTLRNLNLTSPGSSPTTGIAIYSAGLVYVQEVRISGYQTGISVAGGTPLSISHIVIRDCNGGSTGFGVGLNLLNGTATTTLSNSEITNCGTGIHAPSGRLAATNLSLAFNGVGATSNGSAVLSFDRTLISGSSIAGVQSSAGSTMQFSDSTFVNNVFGIAGGPYTGAVESYGNNRMKHNGTVGLFTTNLALR